MNEESIFNLIKSLVDKNEQNRIYPSYITLIEVMKLAKDKFSDFDSEKFKDIAREMVKSKKLYAGTTINDVWLSHKKNNLYENTKN